MSAELWGAREGWRRYLDDPAPLVKQAPTAIAVGVALLLIWLIPGFPVVSWSAVAAGVATITVLTVAALVLGIRQVHDGWVVLLIPIVDILGIGLLRMGTGGASSLFSSLVLLPVVWIAAAPGFRHVFIAAGFTSVALLMPYLFDPPADPILWLRSVITPLVFGAVGALINELSRLQRLRTAQAEALVAERTAALQENVAMVAQLRESEQQYRTLLDSFESLWNSITAQAVIATDRRGRIVAWNPGAVRLLGLTVEEALADVRVDRFFPSSVLTAVAEQHGAGTAADGPAGIPHGLRVLFEAADQGQPVDTDLDISTASGSTVPARVTVTTRRDGTGARRGYLLVITDETRAAEVARMKDEFVGMISHELRTPLSAIIGFLDLLRNDPGQPLTGDQAEFVTVIERNAKRLLNLVGDLLFTARVESGGFPLEREDADIGEIVRSAVASARPHARRQGLELVAETPQEQMPLTVDAGRVGQALDNLLSNAIKFTPRGGRVTTTVEIGDGKVLLSVRDTGIGIPEDEQGMLFTRFFRASTATRNAVPGVGLGLTITRAIVIAHNGTMEVTSAEGVGTEFRITLPSAL